MVDTRKYAVSVLSALSEKQRCEFIRLFADEETLRSFEDEMYGDELEEELASSDPNEPDPFYSEENMKWLLESKAPLEKGDVITIRYNSQYGDK